MLIAISVYKMHIYSWEVNCSCSEIIQLVIYLTFRFVQVITQLKTYSDNEIWRITAASIIYLFNLQDPSSEVKWAIVTRPNDEYHAAQVILPRQTGILSATQDPKGNGTGPRRRWKVRYEPKVRTFVFCYKISDTHTHKEI